MHLMNTTGTLAAIVAVTALVAAAPTAIAVTDEPAVAGAAQLPRHVEVLGDREFSGQLIARPIQADKWTEQSVVDGPARLASARTMLAEFEIIEYRPHTDIYVFKTPDGKTDNAVVEELTGTGLFQYVEPDWIVFAADCPDDPLLPLQWHHDKIKSCPGWDRGVGDPSVVVGICDTGILHHEDLRDHRLEGYDAVGRRWESEGGDVRDARGHGTRVSGCAVATGNNGKGVSGVAQRVSHRMMRVGVGLFAHVSTLTHAAETAVEAGCKIANVSYSGVESETVLVSATYIKSQGGLLIWAAGNDSQRLDFRERDDDDVIVVGGTDQSDGKASFSAYGPYVDLVAPATSILSTNIGSSSSYWSHSGTSYATPLVTGLAALIWSIDPSLEPDEVERILKEGCDDLGDPELFGYGRINVHRTLSLVQTCYADCDDSSDLDFFDFLCFQNEFAAGEADADCDESGDLDFFDFLCFQNEFAAGCP